MSAWITGFAMGPYMPDPDSLQVHLTREAAIEALKDEMKTFAEEQDQTWDDPEDEEYGRTEAHWGAIWNAPDGDARPQIEAGGEIHLSLPDTGDYAWSFWVVPAEEKYYNFGDVDDEPRTAENALQEWINTYEGGLDTEHLLQFTRVSQEIAHMTEAEAVHNLNAIAYAATYHGFDLDAAGYPLPKEI